jgi:pyroglutamyl-peptidase
VAARPAPKPQPPPQPLNAASACPPARAGRLARAGHPVALSRDAGRYVCNYAYYEALRAAAAAAPLISALFVHVPPFAAVPAAAQEAALRALLAELAREGAADAVGERRAPWRRCACL